MKKREWERIKERLPREYKWEIQLAGRRNKKERTMIEMLIGIKREIDCRRKRRVNRGFDSRESTIRRRVMENNGDLW